MSEEKTVTGKEVPPLVTPATPENPPAQATTTSEEDKHSKGQRTINLVWEITQALIAMSVINVVLYVAAHLALQGSGTAFVLLSNLASLVIGFYFGRTNHQKVGGVIQGR